MYPVLSPTFIFPLLLSPLPSFPIDLNTTHQNPLLTSPTHQRRTPRRSHRPQSRCRRPSSLRRSIILPLLPSQFPRFISSFFGVDIR